MTVPDLSLGLLSRALGSAGIRVLREPSAGRWRGAKAHLPTLAVGASTSHRLARLQVLRRVCDLLPEGRSALRIQAGDDALVGPLRPLGRSALDVDECLSTWPRRVLLRRLFLWVDGRRVDLRVRALFPGAAPDLSLDPVPALPPALARLVSAHDAPVDAAGSLHLALALHRQLLVSYPSRRFGVRVANTAFALLPGSQRVHGRSHGANEGDNVGAATSEAVREPETGGVLQDGDLPPGDDEASAPRAASPASEVLADTAVSTLRSLALPSTARPVQGVTRHDEWDHRQQAYLKHWVSVHERRLPGTDMHFRADVLGRFPELVRHIRGRLARLGLQAPLRQRRLQDGEGIDMGAALEAFIDRRVGLQTGDGRYYETRQRKDRDLCVALLVDTSASTGFVIPNPSRDARVEDDVDDLFWHTGPRQARGAATSQRRVIDVFKDAAVLLCEAFQSLGDRHAVYAFSGRGRHHVAFDVAKRFDQAGSAESGAAIAALQPTGATRTGAAVRHALRLLRPESARRKMLIVLSDGYPQDDDYGSDALDRPYGLLDTAHALREAERQGVVTFNVSVDAAANDYLRRMCPKDRYLVIDEADALPGRMLGLFTRLAGSGF